MATSSATRGSALRAHVRQELGAHLSSLGFTNPRIVGNQEMRPEIVRLNPVRGSLAYGETVLRDDLERPRCHERLMSFSQRRTRRRSTILFFIGVLESHKESLEKLLEDLGIRSAVSGGHVHIVAVPAPSASCSRGARSSSNGRGRSA